MCEFLYDSMKFYDVFYHCRYISCNLAICLQSTWRYVHIVLSVHTSQFLFLAWIRIMNLFRPAKHFFQGYVVFKIRLRHCCIVSWVCKICRKLGLFFELSLLLNKSTLMHALHDKHRVAQPRLLALWARPARDQACSEPGQESLKLGIGWDTVRIFNVFSSSSKQLAFTGIEIAVSLAMMKKDVNFSSARKH